MTDHAHGTDGIFKEKEAKDSAEQEAIVRKAAAIVWLIDNKEPRIADGVAAFLGLIAELQAGLDFKPEDFILSDPLATKLEVSTALVAWSAGGRSALAAIPERIEECRKKIYSAASANAEAVDKRE